MYFLLWIVRDLSVSIGVNDIKLHLSELSWPHKRKTSTMEPGASWVTFSAGMLAKL